jgi:uncharacterized protein YdeI (YjbR/CyaY-like superfamily)
MTARSFPSVLDMRKWLEANHASVREIRIRLRKSGATGPGVTYPEALDLALCFGWIDGVRHSIDGTSFAVRFSPRKARSIWSKVNLRHYERLERTGFVAPAGREAFLRRDPKRTGLYSFESRPQQLPPAHRRIFQSSPSAWAFFSAQPPSYRRTATFWVVSAKQEATRERRLAQLISDSSRGRRLGMLARPAAGAKLGDRKAPP